MANANGHTKKVSRSITPQLTWYTLIKTFESYEEDSTLECQFPQNEEPPFQIFSSLPRQSTLPSALVLTVDKEIILSNSVSTTSTEGLMYVFIVLWVII